MRKLFVLLVSGTLAMVAVPGSAAPGGGAAVAHVAELPCQVAWFDTVDPFAYNDPSCRVHSVRPPEGAYHLVLHGRIPAEFMGEFVADGSPRTHEGACLANYGWLWATFGSQSNWPADWADGLTTSVRRFTPNGRMTEVCHLEP